MIACHKSLMLALFRVLYSQVIVCILSCVANQDARCYCTESEIIITIVIMVVFVFEHADL